MSAMATFHQLTADLVNLLEQNVETDRDHQIKKVEALLKKRGKTMTLIEAPLSADEKELGAQIMELNKKLDVLLKQEKASIQSDIKKAVQKKKSTKAYVNPYAQMNVDGFFYDKRK